MEIEVLTPEKYNQYNKFLLKNPDSLFYHSLQYKDFLKELLDCQEEYLISVESNEIKGIFPLLYTESKYGKIYNSLPYYGSTGGIIADEMRTFKMLTSRYNDIIYNDEIASSTVIANPLLEQDYSKIEYNLTDSRIGQFTNLELGKDFERNFFSQIDSSARRNIRKAINSGLTVEIDNNQIEFLKETHKENMMAIGGKAKSDVFFDLINKYFIPGSDYNIYIVKKEGELISALLLFYFNKIVEYFVPVTRKKYRNFQPMSLIIFQAMQDAVKKGYRLWNWGGTWLTQDGVYKFKKKWGAIEKKYSYYVKINNKKIYELSKEDILKECNNFFVIPFQKLSYEKNIKKNC